MKKVTSLLLLVGVAAFGLVACGDNVVPPDEGNVEGVTVTPSTLNIAVGGSGALSADVDGDPDNSVTWSSNNTSVATVDGDGNVTGVAEGNAVVTATSTVDDGHSASATINVTALEEADISIQSVTDADGLGSVPDDVEGRIFVRVNLEEGDKTVDDVQVYFEDTDGNRVLAGTQQFASASQVEGAEAQGEVSEIEFNINTADAEGELDGSVQQGKFGNGTQNVIGVANLADGSSVEATWNETLTFDNVDRIEVTAFEVGDGTLNTDGTVRYFGGMDLVFAATPIIYTPDLDVASVSLTGTTAGATATVGTGHVDLGAGAGAAMTDSEAPFRFTAAYDDNLNAVEDDPTAAGHTLAVTDARDSEGAAISGQFTITNLTEFHIDDAGPDLNVAGLTGDSDDGDGTSEVLVFNSTVPQLDDPDDATPIFFGTGAFVLDDVAERGVGGENGTFRTIVSSTSDTIPETAGPGDLDELDEDYDADVVTMTDDLGNPAVEADVDAVAQSGLFGVDQTAVAITDVLPTETLILNTDDDATDGEEDNALTFTAEDPTVPTAAGGTAAGAGYLTSTAEADDGTATTDITTAINPNAGAGAVNHVQVGDGPAIGGAVPAALADGSWNVTVTTTDNSILSNVVETSYDFIIDTTDPETQMVNPPSSSVTSSNSSLTFTIEGNASDANGLSEVIVSARDKSAGDATACELSDTPLTVGSGPGEVDQNEVDVTADADGFSVNFTIQNTGGANQDVCWFIESADNAVDNGGDPEPNTSNQSANTVIDWV